MKPATSIAVYGGSFNPVHSGHLIVAEEIRQLFALRQVVFVPAAHPPHKPADSVLDAAHRVNMLRLALADNPCFTLSELEIERGGASYTVDTLADFRRRLGPEGELYFILGSDAFVELEGWKEPHRLFELARFIVIERPGALLSRALQFLERFHPVPWCVLKAPLLAAERLPQENFRKGPEIFFVQATLANISSSGIRKLVRAGRSIRYLVPEAVASYIEEHGLYK